MKIRNLLPKYEEFRRVYQGPKETNNIAYPIVDKNGNLKWRNDRGEAHREGGPAVILDNAQEWWFNGNLHRVGGPAIEYADGSYEWYLNGKLHRKDGPAIDDGDGNEEWWLNGKRQFKKGMSEEFVELDEANETFADIIKILTNAHKKGDKSNAKYYLGIAKAYLAANYTIESPEFTKIRNLLPKYEEFRRFYQGPKETNNMAYPIVDKNRNLKWRNDKGQAHREGGPAVILDNAQEWWVNGNLHRKDGPAIEYADGSYEWYLNGVLHRKGGPAIDDGDGNEEWWVNGKRLK